MMNEFAPFSNTVIVFAATYFVHSTLLLAMCWLITTLARPKSNFLAERMWKLATVLGILTAFSQLLVGPDTFRSVMQSPTDRVGASAELLSESDQLRDLSERNGTFSATVETIPGSIESVVAVEDGDMKINDLPPENTVDSVPFETRIETLEPMASLAEELDPNALDSNTAQSRKEPLALTSEQYDRAWLPPILLQWCAIVLLCVFVAGGLLLIVQTTRLRLRFGGARVLLTGSVRNTLDGFLKRHKIRGKIRLLASQKHCEPIAYGLFRWTIVLPEAVEDRLTPNELKALLAHEVAHLVRGDVRWLWIGRALCTCCAFQPLNFLARRHWQQAAEYLCDDWALERGIRSLSLACCLTRVAEWRVGVETSQIGLAAGGAKATLVQRVKRLVEEQPQRDAWKAPWRRSCLTMSAALVVVALVGFTPRIALPLTFVEERAANASPNPREASIDEPAASDWHTLEEQLLQLEADLNRVEQLSVAVTLPTEVAARFQELNLRAASLRARREYIASLLEKESQR
jgi:beta-lactamase regulating signal transducer with metallopeptidase domain